MLMKRFLLGVGALVLSSSVASAQERGTSSQMSAPQRFGEVFLNLNTLNARAAAAAQGGGATSARKYIPRVFAGVWVGAGDGFLFGGGVSTRPFSEEKHEIQGNVALNRVEGSNGLGVDVDYLYNFSPPSRSSVTPFAAAGINITHFSNGDCDDLKDVLGVDFDCGGTNAALQLGGGIKKPMTNGKEVFVELYFVLDSGSPVIIRGGVGW